MGQELTHAVQQTMRGSLDHLVSAQQKRLRNFEAERLGGRKVDDEFEFGRLLDRDVGGLRTAQNFVYKFGGASEQVRKARPIAHQTPRFDVSAMIVHRR